MNFKKIEGKGFQQTKIVATIGPASNDKETLLKLMRAGMSVARLNFSHGSHDDHREVVRRIRELSEAEDIPVAILQDLSGPKIRLGNIETPVELIKGTTVTLSSDPDAGADLYTEFKQIAEMVKAGDAVLIDDGYIELSVSEVEGSLISCKVTVPGTAKSRKGINLPDSEVNIDVFTEKDREDLAFGLKEGIDIIAMSFVQDAEDLEPVKKMVVNTGRNVPVIAKIERPVALNNIDEIIEKFDGIMIARGDLGVEVPPEQVPLIQKNLIELANRKNKITITATQMLESMISNPRPTRAEASDVSNAIIDGSDAVMLSGETAVGKYPDKAVYMMRRISEVTEGSKIYNIASKKTKDIEVDSTTHTESIVKAAVKIAKDLKAKYILVFSYTGSTARIISKYRPECRVFAFTPQKGVARQMSLYWGITPLLIEFTPYTDEMMIKGEELLKLKGLVKEGDLVVTVSGVTPMKGATNMVKVASIS